MDTMLDKQRALRRQIVCDQLTLAREEYAEAIGRGNARLTARSIGKIRRAEAALAALDQHSLDAHTIAHAPTSPLQAADAD